MDVRNKTDLISRILKKIESENDLTRMFGKLSKKHKLNPEQDDAVQVYWDLIKYIIDQKEIPNNICAINIKVDNSFKISGYEMICNATGKCDSDLMFDLEFDK